MQLRTALFAYLLVFSCFSSMVLGYVTHSMLGNVYTTYETIVHLKQQRNLKREMEI